MGKRYRLQDGSAFFVTTTAHNFNPIFLNDDLYQMGMKSLGFCLNKYGCSLCAFVFMPNHWHGILWKENGFDLSGFMRDFKRFTSVQIRKHLVKFELDQPFIVSERRSGRPEYRIWMNRFDVVAIKTLNVLLTKTSYIHDNPVRKELVIHSEDWLYSSAGFYKNEQDVGLPISWIG
jgi:putative transposase